MTILVTGGAGFIGSHLVDKLVENGDNVVVLDNSKKNIARNLKHPKKKVKVYAYDIRNNDDLDDLGMVYDFDCIVHLAGLADIVPSIEDPWKYHETNVDGTVNVLEFARKQKVSKFIYAASGSCYGDNPPYPTTEDHPCDPQYPYALTKYIGEQYALHYHHVYGLPSVSLRFFNVYGPRSRTTGAYGAMFGVFLSQKLHGKPYTIVGDGSQSRDFVYVSDAVEAICASIRKGKPGGTYNICSGANTPVNHIVDLLGRRNGVTYIPRRPHEPQVTKGSITKAQIDLGWQPAIAIADGVKEMLKNISYWKDAPLWDEQSIWNATRSWFKYLGDPNADRLSSPVKRI